MKSTSLTCERSLMLRDLTLADSRFPLKRIALVLVRNNAFKFFEFPCVVCKVLSFVTLLWWYLHACHLHQNCRYPLLLLSCTLLSNRGSINAPCVVQFFLSKFLWTGTSTRLLQISSSGKQLRADSLALFDLLPLTGPSPSRHPIRCSTKLHHWLDKEAMTDSFPLGMSSSFFFSFSSNWLGIPWHYCRISFPACYHFINGGGIESNLAEWYPTL